MSHNSVTATTRPRTRYRIPVGWPRLRLPYLTRDGKRAAATLHLISGEKTMYHIKFYPSPETTCLTMINIILVVKNKIKYVTIHT